MSQDADESPSLVTLEDIERAAVATAPHVHRTPVTRSSYLGDRLGVELYLKLDMFQKTGSFKPRGVLNRIANLSSEDLAKGVVSFSSGNHAQALAYAASMMGAPSTVVMPAGAVRAKVDATRGYGGEVVLTDGDLLQTALDIQSERGLTLIHPFDHPDTIAGTGTLGLEILREVRKPDVVICGVGGGGLISGVAAALKLTNPAIRVIGVEPDGAPGMTLALEAGKPVHLDRLDTVADGLAAPFAGRHNIAHVNAFVDDVVTVDDSSIVDAMGTILERTKVLAEPAAASTCAALLMGKVRLGSGETVVCVLSGGNIDRARLAQLLTQFYS